MESADYKKLDNPVWHSLNESHKDFAINYGNLKCYKPDVCPFGGYGNGNNNLEEIASYAKLINNFFIVGNKPLFSNELVLKNELVCLQMIWEGSIAGVEIVEKIVKLNHEYEDALFGLVNLVQPGYFKNKTSQLGDYYGIFQSGNLVAVAGERMKMDDFVEVSAIVTHPEHTGKGYAKQLTAHVVNKILNQHKKPYLHVAETNTGAISLYRKLCFEVRGKISFWNMIAL
ncbi:MAG: GNAT family N-acetyltransferase [Chitinophagaceae bacterium]